MTEGWCYGTMSVFAPRKGHHCQRGLWEMTPHVLLLILALTACLTEPVHCQEDDGSGVQERDAQFSLTTTHTPAVTSAALDITVTVHSQEEMVSGGDETLPQVTSEKNFHSQEEMVSRGAQTLAQVTSEKNSTLSRISNETDTKARNTTTVMHEKGRKLPSNSTAGDTQDHQGQDNDIDSSPEPDEKEDQELYIIVAACLVIALLLVAALAGFLFVCRRRRKNTPDPEKEDPYLDDECGEKVPMPMFEDDMPSVMELEMEDFEKWMIKEGGDVSVESKERHPS